MCDILKVEAFYIFGTQEVLHNQLEDMLAALPDYDYIGVGRNSTLVETLDEATGQMVQTTQYDFTPVAIFWVVASVISFLLPVLNWKYRK